MPKIIKKVQEVMEKAERNGVAKSTPYEAEKFEGGMRLFHYGTLIYKDVNNNLVELGGWSRSDQDAIYTAMQTRGQTGIPTKSEAVVKKANKQGTPVRELHGWFLIKG